MTKREFWIFEVIGGESFDMQVKGNPVMRHDGKRSILRSLCTDEQAAELEEEMKGRGCRVKSNSPRETDEQREERDNVLAVLGGDRSFPCVRCPECAWFDPHVDGLCGAGLAHGHPGWDDPAVSAAITNDKFRADFETCPLREETTQ